MEILVLGGGDSPEREVSLRSAKAVADAARQAGFNVREADPKDDTSALDNLSAQTIVFPILHGAGGEDGVIQSELEKRKLAFLGSGSESSRNCFDKWATRESLQANGLPMPKAVRVNKETYSKEQLSKQPHVLKIVHGGSSIGTLVVRDPSFVGLNKIAEIFNLENKAILEELIEGSEITVPVLDGRALPVIEIIPPTNGEFDYDNKYNGKTQELVPPKTVSEELQKQARDLAEKAHKVMGCRHLSRVDMMIGQNGKIFILEVNTMPGMADGCLYPKSAVVAGMYMPGLTTRFVELVKRDYSI